MTVLKYSIVDVFASIPFRGNSAAVIVFDFDTPLITEDDTLKNIASEFNLPITSYVFPTAPDKGDFLIRYFTPKSEVFLCGHGTLAAAHVLFSTGQNLLGDTSVISFETSQSATLKARHSTEGRVELELPAGDITSVNQVTERELIRRALNSAFAGAEKPQIRFIGRGGGQDSKDSYKNYLLVEVDRDFDLQAAVVHPDAFMAVAPRFLTVVITQRGNDETETFKSRVFCPGNGVPEDPATGSAHSFIGPYWADKVNSEGKHIPIMLGRQVSARGGEVRVCLAEDRKTVKVQGQAILVARGEFFL